MTEEHVSNRRRLFFLMTSMSEEECKKYIPLEATMLQSSISSCSAITVVLSILVASGDGRSIPMYILIVISIISIIVLSVIHTEKEKLREKCMGDFIDKNIAAPIGNAAMSVIAAPFLLPFMIPGDPNYNKNQDTLAPS